MVEEKKKTRKPRKSSSGSEKPSKTKKKTEPKPKKVEQKSTTKEEKPKRQRRKRKVDLELPPRVTSDKLIEKVVPPCQKRIVPHEIVQNIQALLVRVSNLEDRLGVMEQKLAKFLAQ